MRAFLVVVDHLGVHILLQDINPIIEFYPKGNAEKFIQSSAVDTLHKAVRLGPAYLGDCSSTLNECSERNLGVQQISFEYLKFSYQALAECLISV